MITIIGSGKVGVSTAAFLMLYELDTEITLIDIIEGLPQGEALDLNHASAILGKAVKFKGSNSYEDLRNSDIVIITAGLARGPGMTREELVAKNAEIISNIAKQVAKYAPEAKVLITTNPVDVMAYIFHKKSGFNRSKVMGFGGTLDAGRMSYYVSEILQISPDSVTSIVLGQHGENLYPVIELSSAYGKPLSELLPSEYHSLVTNKVIQAGAEIVKLKKTSSSWGPAAGLVKIVESIKKDKKAIALASVYLDGEYGVKDIFACVPVIVGKNGVDKILELNLTEQQRLMFLRSINAIRDNLKQVPLEFLT